MGFESVLQNPVVGVIGGSVVSSLFGDMSLGMDSCVMIESENRVKTTVYFQFNPDYKEEYSNKIDSFAPVKGSKSYANYVNRGEERLSFSSMYFARTKDEAEKIESFVSALREIAKPEDNTLPAVNVYIPFKREVLRALVSGVNITYSNDYISSSAVSGSSVASRLVSSGLNILKSASGASTDLPRKVEFSIDLIIYNELPDISSIFSDLAKTTNYYISNSRRRGSSTGRKTEKPAGNDGFLEAIKDVTQD